jgi:hypothetical protein
MTSFEAIIEKFGEMGEKTGWMYILIPAEISEKIKSNTRKSYRVKGLIDNYALKMTALLPMGEGDFIIPFNDKIKKVVRKSEGQIVKLSLEEDTDTYELSSVLLDCLAEEPKAIEAFDKLPPSHQRYYSKWVEETKTIETKSRRIIMIVHCFRMGINDYGAMMRYYRDQKNN